MSISDEFAFIKRIQPQKSFQPSLVKGIGDDSALFSGNDQVEEIVCMDTMVEDVHFNRKTMKPFDIGFKALAANISDIAAMGGYPTYYLVSIAIPPTWSEEELVDIYHGMDKLAKQYQIDLIGGDTVSTKEHLVVTVTVLGRVEKGKHLLRSNAKQGDIVFVTGSPGDSAAGLSLLLEKGHDHHFSELENVLIEKHQRPLPRVEAGRILAKFPRVALNDISDGVASEANEISEASNTSIIIEEDQLPKSKQILSFDREEQLKWILFGGEDFELIGTIAEQEWNQLQEECMEAGIALTAIGFVGKGDSGVYLKNSKGLTPLDKKGYNHFSS